jgi:pentatricopeptide repeat protein
MRTDTNIKQNTILNTTVIKMFNLEKNLKAAKELFETMLKSR